MEKEKARERGGSSDAGNADDSPSTPTKAPLPQPKQGGTPFSKVTTGTVTLANNTVNAYDAVLSEAQDFIQAASEAQQLGRLNLSSSYLALSHSRIVGLAKRFDLAATSSSKGQPSVLDDQLKALLPADVEWDQDMMTHLASAAAEYHAARKQQPPDEKNHAEGGSGGGLGLTTVPAAGSVSVATVPQANCDVRSVLHGDSLVLNPATKKAR